MRRNAQRSAAGSLAVEVTVGSAAALEVSGDDNNERLHVGRSNGVVSTKLPRHVKITTPALIAYTCSGSTTTAIAGIAGDAFDLSESGSSHVTLAGGVQTFHVHTSGSAHVDASALHAGAVTAGVVERQ